MPYLGFFLPVHSCFKFFPCTQLNAFLHTCRLLKIFFWNMRLHGNILFYIHAGYVHFYKTWQHCVEETLSLLLVLYGQITYWQCERMNILFLSFSCNSDFIGVISLCTLICICDTVVYTNTYTCIVISITVCAHVYVCVDVGGGGAVCAWYFIAVTIVCSKLYWQVTL